MDSIEQLRAMRDEAKVRIESMPDYKLMTKLTTLIEELEEVFGITEPGATTSEEGTEEAEEEVERSGPPTLEPPSAEAEADNPEPVSIAEPPVVTITQEDTVAEIAEGLAQLEIERTAVTSPLHEISDELVEIEAEVEAEPEPTVEPEHEQTSGIDASTALEQAMAELEADLGKASLEEPRSSRFRYGNSS